MSGWGAQLELCLDGVGTVRNFAKGGATTASFRGEGLWAELMRATRPGDWVLIQFGHNDQKDPALPPDGGFTKNMEAFAREAQERGAIPVLCTSVERRCFAGSRQQPTHGGYPQAVRDLGRRLEVAVIDLTIFTSWLYEHEGPEASKQLFTYLAPGESDRWPDGLADDTHFSVRGARQVAAYVARALRPLLRLDADQPPLGPALMAPIPVT